jgi:hypothetical protein
LTRFTQAQEAPCTAPAIRIIAINLANHVSNEDDTRSQREEANQRLESMQWKLTDEYKS